MSVESVRGGLVRPKTNQYRTNHRCALVATQAANSRLFEIRNPAPTGVGAPTVLVILRLQLKWLQTAAHTAAIEDSLDVFRCTAFTAEDTVGVVTPVSILKRTGMAATPNAIVRGVTVAGAAGGMTGGTLTKDGGTYAQLPQWLLAAQPTGGQVVPAVLDALDQIESNDNHPLSLGANEGIIIENRVLLGAAAGSSLYIDVEFAEFPA